MLGGLKSSITNSVITNVLRGIASNPDTRTTALGAGLAAVIAAQVNFGALIFQHDLSQLGVLLAAALVWALGYWTNKHPQAQKLVDALLKRVAELEEAREKSDPACDLATPRREPGTSHERGH